MKTTSILLLIAAPLALAPVVLRANEDLSVQNLTISASAAVGTIYSSGGSQTTTMPGFRISVDQASANETITHYTTVQPAPTWEEVTVEEYGWVEEGYYQDHYQWGLISSDWVDAVIEDHGNYTDGEPVWMSDSVEIAAGYYDEDDNWIDPVYEDVGMWVAGEPVWVPDLVEVAPGYWDEQWGDVLVGQSWVSTGGHQVVTGTRTELQQVQHPDIAVCYFHDYISGGPPRIEFTSTRSDANFVWQVPDNEIPGSPARDVLIVGNGGISIPSHDPNVQMHLFGDSLTQSRADIWTEMAVTYAAEARANETRLRMNVVHSTNATEADEANLTAEHLRLMHRETVPGQVGTVTTQTQVAARSAHFGGVVTVQGNLKVQGVVRVAAAGNLSMGEFTNGPTPLN